MRHAPRHAAAAAAHAEAAAAHRRAAAAHALGSLPHHSHAAARAATRRATTATDVALAASRLAVGRSWADDAHAAHGKPDHTPEGSTTTACALRAGGAAAEADSGRRADASDAAALAHSYAARRHDEARWAHEAGV